MGMEKNLAIVTLDVYCAMNSVYIGNGHVIYRNFKNVKSYSTHPDRPRAVMPLPRPSIRHCLQVWAVSEGRAGWIHNTAGLPHAYSAPDTPRGRVPPTTPLYTPLFAGVSS